MKVLLVNPPIPSYFYNREYYFPSSLLALAAILQRYGHEPKILDFKIYQRGSEDPSRSFYELHFIEEIRKFNPDLIGLGCLFSGNFPDTLWLSRIAKQTCPHIPVIMGGIHGTLYAHDILTHCPSLDAVVLGEGEETLIEMVVAMQAKISWTRIEGLGCRTDAGQVVVNEKTSYTHDVDSLPMPAYDLIDIEDYHVDTSAWHNPKGLPINTSVPIISSRSCPNRCTFCSMYKVMGPRWRARSATNVVDEIESVYQRFNHRHFSFMDDNVTLKKGRMVEICQQIIDRGLDIQFETPNGISVKTIDEEVLDAMVKAGLVRTCLAIESGSEYIRNQIMKKHLSNEKIYEVLALVRRYPQLFVNAFFLIGMPEETAETLEETYRMIEKIRVDKTIVMNLVPFPGTETYRQAVRDNLLVGVPREDLYLSNDRYFTNYDQIFLKPYALELDDIRAFRQRVNRLLERQQQSRRHKNPNPRIANLDLSQGKSHVDRQATV